MEQRAALVAMCLGLEDYESFSSSKLNELKMVLENWKNNANIIQKIVDIYKLIDKPKNTIKELYDYNLKIYNSTLQYLNSNDATKEFLEKCKNLEKINKIHTLRESKVFISILYVTKNEIFRNSKDFIDLVFERFDKLKNIFVNDKTGIENELIKNKEAKFLINISASDEENLEKEINWLLNYFIT